MTKTQAILTSVVAVHALQALISDTRKFGQAGARFQSEGGLGNLLRWIFYGFEVIEDAEGLKYA